MKRKFMIMVTFLIVCTGISASIPCSMGVERNEWDCFVWRLDLSGISPNGHHFELTYYLRFFDHGWDKRVYTIGRSQCDYLFRGGWNVLPIPNGQKLLVFQLNKNNFNLTFDYIGDYNICGNGSYLYAGSTFVPVTFHLFNITENYLHCFPGFEWPWYGCPW